MLTRKTKESNATDLALLALRATTGGLLAGHGAQKLWGAFGGYGIEGTAGWLESLGLKPGKQWAYAAGLGEFLGGASMALGLLTPLGSIGAFGPMITAWLVSHRGKPIWVTAGGAELPLTNMAVQTALVLAGPGRYSLDRTLGIRVPKALSAVTAAGVLGGIIAVETMYRRHQAAEEEQDQARDELQSQGESETEQANEVGAQRARHQRESASGGPTRFCFACHRR
jgi:putative oxidoreductase